MRRLLLVLALALSAAPAAAEPPRHGEHEIIYTRPSGFWTSNRPAPPGQQYKWRLLEIGVAVGLLTGLLLRRTIKKANAERAARANLPDARTLGRKDDPAVTRDDEPRRNDDPPSPRPPSP